MEPEGSLSYSQEPAICPYLETTPTSPHNLIQLSEDPSPYYPPIYVWVYPMASFPQSSPPTSSAHLYPSYAPQAPPMSFFSILPPAQYWVKNTNHTAPHYVCFSIPLHLVPFRPKYTLNTLLSNTRSLRSALGVSDHVSHPYKTAGKMIDLLCHDL
jgi:hypothetical protein